MARSYSYSQVSGFENCPRKYKFQYIERPEVEKPVGVELFLGSAIHKALENIYQLKIDDITAKLEEMLHDYHEYWEGPERDHIKVTREHLGVDDYIKKGEELIKRYFENYHPFEDSETVALEKNISFPLDPNGRYTIKSRIDRISHRKSDDTIEIIDYKTDRTLPTQQALNNDEQLGLYHIGVNHLWPQFEKVEAKKIFLRQGIEMSTAMSKETLEEIRYKAYQKILEIEQAIKEDNFSPKESNLCDWCLYQELCPAKRHQMALDDKITDDFDAKAGQEMAEKYLKLSREKKLADSEMKALKDDIVSYCEQTDLSNIEAEHGSINVKIVEGMQLPGKTASEDDYLQLSIIARDSGLDECFKLDQNILYKDFLVKNKLPEELAEKLKKFLIKKRQTTIRTRHKGQ